MKEVRFLVLFISLAICASSSTAADSQAEIFMQQGKYHEAYDLLNACVLSEQNPTEIVNMEWLSARCLWELHDYPAFSESVSKFALRHPESEQAYWLLLWDALIGKLNNDLPSSIKKLNELATNSKAPLKVRLEAKWGAVECLYKTGEYDSYAQAYTQFVQSYPEAKDKIELGVLWSAFIPALQNSPASSVPLLQSIVQNNALSTDTRTNAEFKLIEFLYASNQDQVMTDQINKFILNHPDTDKRADLDYWLAMIPMIRSKPTDAADQMAHFINIHPNDPRIEEVSFSHIRMLHEAKRYTEIDAAADKYLIDFPHSNEADFVAYHKMLVPLNISPPNWSDAILRCDSFKSTYPNSQYAPNSDLNKGWAQHEMSLLAKASGNDAISADFQAQCHNSMEQYRVATTDIANDAPLKERREIEVFDSYFHEADYAALGSEALKQSRKYQANPSRYATALYYYGVSQMMVPNPNVENALAIFDTVLLHPGKSGTYDDLIMMQSGVWSLMESTSLGRLDISQKTYDEIQLSAPESPFKTQLLHDFSFVKQSDRQGQ